MGEKTSGLPETRGASDGLHSGRREIKHPKNSDSNKSLPQRGRGTTKVVDEESIFSPITLDYKTNMIYNYSKKLVPNARTLRKNMTKEEKHIWYDFLKNLPVTVNRQKNIGNYIVDFFIAEKRVVIEIDGSQHGMEGQKAADEKRDADLNALGITVLRYRNQDINQNFYAVCQDILLKLNLEYKPK